MATIILKSTERIYKVLGFTESVTSCDCCGKQDLKGTYAMEHIESGEISYFGCVCAGKHQGYSKKEFTTEAKIKMSEIVKIAQSELNSTYEFEMFTQQWDIHTKTEWASHDLLIHNLKNVLWPVKDIFDSKKQQIAQKYFLKTYQLR
jgi:hypothetical protein